MGNKATKNDLSQSPMPNQSSSSARPSAWEILNLETFLLVWLDPHVNTSNENISTQMRLREILTSLVTFDNVQECEKWLKKCANEEKIVLIVSGAFGEQLVPKVHYLPCIIFIYVYCLDVYRNIPWSETYPKIRSVVSNTEILIRELSANQINLEDVEDSKALEVYSLDMNTASYLWYPLLLEILLSSDYLPSNSTSNEFLQILREYSSDHKYGLNLISEFEQTYRSEQAVSCLIDDTLLARFSNKVLRERDVNMLFSLRFLLVDTHKQLIKHQTKSLNAYRIQPMIKSQMENSLGSPGQVVVINGFIFASTNKSQLISTMTKNDQFETVLINIQANYRPGVAPFAFLRDMDPTIEEKIDREVLFMCGSIFVVGPLVYEDSLWTLQLTLVGDRDVPELFTRKQKLKQTHNFCVIGDLLDHCGKSDQAVVFYERLLCELPEEHVLIPQINRQLSNISKSPHSDIPSNTRYILANLSPHMTDHASAILGILRSLTSNTIYICDDAKITNFSRGINRSILLFTTAEFAKSLKNLPHSFTVFTLKNDESKVSERNRSATIEDLITQLADKIVRQYRSDAYQHHKTGESNEAKQLEDKAKHIDGELTAIQQKFAIPKKILGTADYSLISLTSNQEDIDSIRQYFDDYFSSFYFFFDEHQCHEHIVEHENDAEIFLLILPDYSSSIADHFRQFSNVKFVYSSGKITDKHERIFPTRKDLYYKLILDLLGYYAELGDRYEMDNQRKNAHDIFVKGQRLSKLLIEHFFSNK